MMSAATFRTPGNATVQQTLFVLMNTGANRVVSIRRMILQVEATAAFAHALMPLFKICRITGYSGGQALTKVAWTATASHADIQARGRNTSDGGTQTNIVATIGETMWQQYAMRNSSTVGQILGEDNNILPSVVLADPVVLRSGQGVLVYLEVPAANTNPNTNHYFVQCAWTEA
jgi:hypothetical protein